MRAGKRNTARHEGRITERITERANPLTRAMDVCSSADACRLIAASERQIFGEGQHRAGVFSRPVISALAAALSRIHHAGGGSATMVAGGAGTSGRLSELVAHLHRRPGAQGRVVAPVLAGGSAAFVRPAIQAEDRPALAVAGVAAALANNAGRSVVLGITCGLSASFVEGMLTTEGPGLSGGVLLGFCEERDAVLNIGSLRAARPDLLLINPIVGAEAVAGSVRMKCGTASLMLLLTLADPAWRLRRITQRAVKACLERFSRLLRFEDALFDQLGPHIDHAAQALESGKTISLIGFDELGLVCVADAAECRATFNSAIGAMTPRVIEPAEADDDLKRRLQALGQIACTTLDQLQADLTDGALKQAFTVFLLRPGELDECARRGVFEPASANGSLVLELTRGQRSSPLPDLHGIPHVAVQTLAQDLGDEALVARSLVTTLTTVLWMRAGRVFGNRMINHRISVRKLFPRAVAIIDEHLGCGRHHATALLQRSIAGCSTGLPHVRDIDGWVGLASTREHVIPRAILLGYHPGAADHELDGMLSSGEGVRSILSRLSAQHGPLGRADGSDTGRSSQAVSTLPVNRAGALALKEGRWP